MYNVVVTPEVTDILIGYAQKCAIDNGIECATNLVDSFDKAINSLETLPKRGIKKLQYIPAKYHIITFWKHLWLVYPVDHDNFTVYIDYLIDDRSNYRRLF